MSNEYKYSFKSKDSCPNFSTTVKIGEKSYEIQCVNGVVGTNDDILGEYLKKGNPFSAVTAANSGVDAEYLKSLEEQLQLKSKLISEKDEEIEKLKKELVSYSEKDEEIKEVEKKTNKKSDSKNSKESLKKNLED